jgi:hypothetical protein
MICNVIMTETSCMCVCLIVSKLCKIRAEQGTTLITYIYGITVQVCVK